MHQAAPELQPIAHDKLNAMCAIMRQWILQQSHASCIGHIGSALSIVEIVAALWGRVMKDPGTADENRDRFVLGKGHAALALYSAMRWRGLIDEDAFATYCGDGTLLSGHPEHWLPGIDVSTGSLGQGLSIGCGMALGLRSAGSSGRVYVLISDAECNEGQVWEAVMFAAQQALNNLCVVIDFNGMQALGPTSTILNLNPMSEKWSAFGWHAKDVNGHDCEAIATAIEAGRRQPAPTVLVARTQLGNGVSFMENRLEWHYRNLTADELALGLSELQEWKNARNID